MRTKAINTPEELPIRTTITPDFVSVASLSELQEKQCLTVQANGHVLALFLHQGQVYAIDNRCPHMGFPLDKGTVQDGILTCHWHHARFDLASGGAFDQFADDVRAFAVEMHGDDILVDVGSETDALAHQRNRLQVGLERDIPLVLGKAALVLMDASLGSVDPVGLFRAGLKFGATYRQNGWGQGLTMLVCFMNMLPRLETEERARALYHGLSAVARDSFGHPPRFIVRPLPDSAGMQDISTLKRWFRQFIEVRDSEGSERCIVSALRMGATAEQMADMLFAAVTDHRYIDIGHPADFTNKAFEALDIAGWDLAEPVLTSLVAGYARAMRQEEANSWRYPIDLVEILEQSFALLPDALSEGHSARGSWQGRQALTDLLLSDNPHDIVEAMLVALRTGCTEIELAQTVAYAAALRIARFHTSNEFGDWDTALHTFTFANAIHQGLRRASSVELLRGVFDAAMSVYLDRFLNIPAARIPTGSSVAGSNGAGSNSAELETILSRFEPLLNQQQQVNQAAALVADYQVSGGDSGHLQAMLGKLLLREDRDFHTVQSIEAAFRQFALLGESSEATNVLIAAARYLAAHSPTVRAQGQTYEIARRLHRGEKLFEND